MSSVPEYFGCDVFDSRVMKSVLPMDIFNRLGKSVTKQKYYFQTTIFRFLFMSIFFFRSEICVDKKNINN